MQDKRAFYIDGQWVAPETAKDHEVIDPSDETPCAVISLGGEADVDRAVAAAKRAFPSFGQSSLDSRIGLLEDLLAVYEKRHRDMAEAISREMGAPITLAMEQQAACGSGHLRAFIDSLKQMRWEEALPPDGEIVIREPIGVCGLITPWNWPMNQISLKVAPALGVGCTVVLKPSEVAPLSGHLFAEMIHEAGFPAGAFNLVNGEGAVVGEAMSRHPDIDMMSFTGSTRAGTAVTKAAAATVKRVTLELGGKSPNIVFNDADLARAIKGGVRHCFNNTGQSCNAPTRMLVQRDVYDEAVALARQVGESVSVGSPREAGRHIGPLVSEVQFDKVQALIQAGIDEGARVVTGGVGRPDGFNRGYYARPTIFADVNNDMRIAREEIFGPVLSMMPFDSEEEAVSIANDTPYGLAAYLQTTDPERARRVSRQLRAGMVHINGTSQDWASPFGGYKQSGNGREGGRFGLEDFLEIKAVSGWSDAA